MMQVAFDNSTQGKCAQQAQYWLRTSNSLFKPGVDMLPGEYCYAHINSEMVHKIEPRKHHVDEVLSDCQGGPWP